MTSSRMRVKRREGAKATLKPVSLLPPVFPTHTRFPRNGEDVMSYHLDFHFVAFFPARIHSIWANAHN